MEEQALRKLLHARCSDRTICEFVQLAFQFLFGQTIRPKLNFQGVTEFRRTYKIFEWKFVNSILDI